MLILWAKQTSSLPSFKTCRLLMVVRYINKYFTMFLKTVSPKTHQGGSWKKLKDKTISLIKMPPKK